ncbi:hypothetical protein PPTG_06355 [Phytophthora nicotianae INRA-310]|uniref:Uncharacterized protein n=1 Tax=Phytophthora nicotianae (strain INRA-310) TaxID=761204 RepID=W2QUG4_PHYN3|nr:hypothetical protein PPTG_06355 [Phytophthora nicotianae INRA-310]ETN16144.1 hypothetical protein PPTG_06355 [Phytophthora nicotianae INRA-310]
MGAMSGSEPERDVPPDGSRVALPSLWNGMTTGLRFASIWTKRLLTNYFDSACLHRWREGIERFKREPYQRLIAPSHHSSTRMSVDSSPLAEMADMSETTARLRKLSLLEAVAQRSNSGTAQTVFKCVIPDSGYFLSRSSHSGSNSSVRTAGLGKVMALDNESVISTINEVPGQCKGGDTME